MTSAALAAAALGLLAVIAAYYRANCRQTARVVLEEKAKHLAAESAFDEDEIFARGDELRRRTLFYSSLVPVHGMIRAIQGGGVDPLESIPLVWWRTNLHHLFSEAVRLNPDMTQLRLIGIADGGRELARVDRSSGGGAPVVTREEDLQRKGDRLYFEEALRLEAGEVYVSAIDLNREHGKIAEPEVATVRISTPVNDAHGRPFGVIVANFDFKVLVAGIESTGQSSPARRHLTYLTDAGGGYLINPEPGRAFRHERQAGSPGWNEDFAADPTGTAELGVALPAALTALRGPKETILFTRPAEVRVGSRLSPIRLQLWQGIPLAVVVEDLRRATRTQLWAAGAMAFAVLAAVGLVVAGFERRLVSSERQFLDRLSRATRVGRVGTWEHEVMTGETVWNEEWRNILGAGSKTLRGGPEALLERVHPDDRDRIRSRVVQLVLQDDFALQFRVLRPDGTVRFVSVQGAPERDHRGRLVRLAGTGTDQTEIRRAEEALRESENKYRQVAESLPQLVWTCEAEGPCDYLSPQWVAFTGIGESSQLGFGWLDQLHPDDRQRAIDLWMATAAQGRDFEVDYRIRRHDGEYRWFHTLARPVRDAGGKITKWFGSNTDIHEQLQAEQRLRESEARFRSLFTGSPDPYLIVSAETGEILDCNHAVETTLRGASKDIVGRPLFEFSPERQSDGQSSADAGRELFRRVSQSDRHAFEWLHRRCDGESFHCLATCVTTHLDGQRVILAGWRDITARKRSEEALRNSQRQLNTALMIARAGAWTYDVAADEFTFNDGFYRIFHATAEDVGGYRLSAADYSRHFVHPDDAGVVAEEICLALQTTDAEFAREFEHRFLLRDGGVGWLAVRYGVEKDVSGRTVRLFGVNQDITALREAEMVRQTHLRTLESLDRVHVAIQRSRDPEDIPKRVLESLLAMFACDGATLIHPCDPKSGTWGVFEDLCNGACAAAPARGQALPAGADAQALFRAFGDGGRTAIQCGPEGVRALPSEFGERFGAKSAMLVRIAPAFGDGWILMIRQCGHPRVWSPDEERILLEVGSRLEDGLSSLQLFRQIRELNSGLETRIQDRTTELTQSNAELRRSNQDLERFAFAASHDLKSPLKAVASLAGWLEEDLGDSVGAESRKHFELLRRRVGRMERLLDDLLRYARAGRVRETVGEISVEQLFSDAVGLVNVPPGFTVKLREGGASQITTAITPVCTMLTNLVSNAIKHHDRNGGAIEVSVEETHDSYRLSVSDDGPGIPAEFREQIWEMFQTIRPRDRVEGSGMGLAIVRRLASFYGGHSEVESREPRGSIFRIVLPKVIPECPPDAHGQ